MEKSSQNGSILSSNFIPMEPEEITADWLFEVINQYRLLKEMSPVKQADDLISCEIAEKKSSKGRLSSTYVIDIKFKVSLSLFVYLQPELLKIFRIQNNWPRK